MDYEKEYRNLVSELSRHMIPMGRFVKLQGFYGITESDERIPAIKLSESPYIFNAVRAMGAVESKDLNGYRTLECPNGHGYLQVMPEDVKLEESE